MGVICRLPHAALRMQDTGITEIVDGFRAFLCSLPITEVRHLHPMNSSLVHHPSPNLDPRLSPTIPPSPALFCKRAMWPLCLCAWPSAINGLDLWRPVAWLVKAYYTVPIGAVPSGVESTLSEIARGKRRPLFEASTGSIATGSTPYTIHVILSSSDGSSRTPMRAPIFKATALRL